ncbi:ATP-dependent DNA helicase PIF1-like [Arachis ipaensis]|uniref:ATP-dependent DNA helicase PIF1-like n=1 Tax=Arachis ipaensis TaxID=130454 RepID=UPI0007AF4496|nr:ATP-dependent DNA helicase PIF1-like [Arachis ipaensis]
MRRDQRSPKQDPILSSQYVVCEERYNCHFEALDRTLRDLMSVTDQHKTHQPFGGKVVVLGGDFRQILPVILKGSRHDILASAINSSHLWSFCKVLKLHTNMRLLMSSSDQDEGEMKRFANWILDVGNGNIGSVVGDESEVEIPDDLLITTTDDPLFHLVDFSYPNLLQNMLDYRYFQSRVILAPTLESVEKVNDFVLTIFPGMEKEYLSSDTTCQADENEDVQQEWFTLEFLNDIKCSGLPNHKLTLKPGVAVMLLRNIDQTSGLCNGTRLIVNELGSNVIGATVVTSRNIGDKVYIPRMNLIPSDSGLPFKFQRRQFSLTVCFAITINMSQAQSLSHVRLYLPKSVFTHGQLYVALSRVKSHSGLRVLILDEDGNPKSSTRNIVFKEVFNNI